jgi:hypothetical protein
MPLCEYKCEAREPHTFERRVGYDDEEVRCMEIIITKNPEGGKACYKPAHRQIPRGPSNIRIIIK